MQRALFDRHVAYDIGIEAFFAAWPPSGSTRRCCTAICGWISTEPVLIISTSICATGDGVIVPGNARLTRGRGGAPMLPSSSLSRRGRSAQLDRIAARCPAPALLSLYEQESAEGVLWSYRFSTEAG